LKFTPKKKKIEISQSCEIVHSLGQKMSTCPKSRVGLGIRLSRVRLGQRSSWASQG